MSSPYRSASAPAQLALLLLGICSCFALLGLLASPARAEPPPLQFNGNRVLSDDVYRALLELPEGAKADAETAAWVESKLLRFLHQAGYVLATVHVQLADGKLDVAIDEGTLDKVVFFGADSIRAVLLRLELALPGLVFNQPYLDRQLGWLAQRYHLPPITYKLVPVEKVMHRGPQLGDLKKMPGSTLIPGSGRYQLHVTLGPHDWGGGLGFDLTYGAPDGLRLGLSYARRRLFFGDDRWRIAGLAGARLLSKIATGTPYLSLSHAALDLRWYSPLIGRGFRPYLWLVGDVISRQRSDLDVELFYAARLNATLNLGYEVAQGMMLSVGGGAEEKFVFGVQRVGMNPPPLPSGRWFQPFIVGRVDLVFNRGEPRRDRLHHLLIDGRYYWVQGAPEFGKVGYQYQLVRGLGWHDLVVGSRAAWLFEHEAVPFDEEEPVGGRYVRGVFSGRDYAHAVGNLTLEFRLSLVRDLFKVSIFNDFACFGRIDRTTLKERFMLADSFGLGFHALILDAVQLDIYYAFGFDLNRTFDHGMAASLTKVY